MQHDSTSAVNQDILSVFEILQKQQTEIPKKEILHAIFPNENKSKGALWIKASRESKKTKHVARKEGKGMNLVYFQNNEKLQKYSEKKEEGNLIKTAGWMLPGTKSDD